MGAYRIDGYWNDVGNPDAYRQGNWDVMRGLVAADVEGDTVSPGVVSGLIVTSTWSRDRASGGTGRRLPGGEGARLLGPVVLGDGCIVEEGAQISSSIGWSGLVAGRGVEVMDSIVGRAGRLHGWVRLNSCVVGDRCVFGDTGELHGLSLEAGTVLWG